MVWYSQALYIFCVLCLLPYGTRSVLKREKGKGNRLACTFETVQMGKRCFHSQWERMEIFVIPSQIGKHACN